jgi:hypothetical protein
VLQSRQLLLILCILGAGGMKSNLAYVKFNTVDVLANAVSSLILGGGGGGGGAPQVLVDARTITRLSLMVLFV